MKQNQLSNFRFEDFVFCEESWHCATEFGRFKLTMEANLTMLVVAEQMTAF